MDPTELLPLLDLNAQPEDARSATIPGGVAGPPPSPTALEVDEWGLRRGRDLIEESDRLRASGADSFAAADYFGAAFDPEPRLTACCSAPRRQEFLTQLLGTPEYRVLHAATRLDDTASSIAAAHFAEQFARLQAEDTAVAGSEAGDDAEVHARRREMVALRAAGRALTDAATEVAELQETTTALGMGPGSPAANDPVAIATIYRRVRNDPGLRAICEHAGRFRRVAQGRQWRKTAHGLDDLVGVAPGGEIGRLLPTELVQLMDPNLELAALRRLAERQALCRDYRAVEPVGKGPILVSVDESGSMEGEKAHTAKALALALAWIARSQRRWCGLVAYSGDSGDRLLALPPACWDESALCDWLAAFIGRGSTLDVPVREMPEFYHRLGAPSGVTDLILITDALARIPDEARQSFLAWKASARVRVQSLVIAHEPGDLAAISDEVFIVPTLDPDSAAVGRVLSL